VIERSQVRLPAGALSSQLGEIRVGKSSTGLMTGVTAECVHLCRVAGNTV